MLKLAKSCHFEPNHTKHVTRLAIKIFSDLEELHHLDHDQKYLLLCASILHDIGVHTEGPKAHHKTALNIILKTPIIQFDSRTRLIIGSVARYHRHAEPSKEHDHFKALKPEDQKIVGVLSGILRVADGLDYSHKKRIRDVRASYNPTNIIFECLTKKKDVTKEVQSARKKGGLLGKLYKRDLKFRILSLDEYSGWS